MTFDPQIRAALVLFLCMLLTGCASSPTPTTYYLLRGEQTEYTGPIETTVRAGLGRVIVAPYLLVSKGIMVETGQNEINPAVHSEWIEPVDAGLRWYLRSEIGRALGRQIGGGISDRRNWDYTIDVVVSRLHGTMDGKAVMEADFVILPADATRGTSQMRFGRTIPLPREGYAGVVEAERALAKELAGLIATELARLENP